jgi:hypothetical protein
MSTHLVAAAGILVLVAVALLTRFLPGLFVDAVDLFIMRLPRRPFLALTPGRDPIVQSLVMGAVLVCGFGLILSLSRQTGLWIVWPAAALVLFLAMGFGVAFATMLWPIVLTAGFVVLRVTLGFLEQVGGEPVPFSDDGPRVSILNVMIALVALLSAYASTLAVRARKAAEEPTSDGRH